jgi:hypothetical protein
MQWIAWALNARLSSCLLCLFLTEIAGVRDTVTQQASDVAHVMEETSSVRAGLEVRHAVDHILQAMGLSCSAIIIMIMFLGDVFQLCS